LNTMVSVNTSLYGCPVDLPEQHVLPRPANLPLNQDRSVGVVGFVKAVDGVSFTVSENEVFRIVGESGSGKTTVARCILRLYKPTAGSILFQGRDVARLKGRELGFFRRSVQAVFQNPFLSLNPRMRVEDIVAEPIRTYSRVSKSEVRERVAELLSTVGLDRFLARGYPYDLSGGRPRGWLSLGL